LEAKPAAVRKPATTKVTAPTLAIVESAAASKPAVTAVSVVGSTVTPVNVTRPF
jgi:hypothetical protein